MRSSRAEIKI